MYSLFSGFAGEIFFSPHSNMSVAVVFFPIEFIHSMIFKVYKFYSYYFSHTTIFICAHSIGRIAKNTAWLYLVDRMKKKLNSNTKKKYCWCYWFFFCKIIIWKIAFSLIWTLCEHAHNWSIQMAINICLVWLERIKLAICVNTHELTFVSYNLLYR